MFKRLFVKNNKIDKIDKIDDPPITDTVKLLIDHEKRLARVEGQLKVLLALTTIQITLLLVLITHSFFLF